MKKRIAILMLFSLVFIPLTKAVDKDTCISDAIEALRICNMEAEDTKAALLEVRTVGGVTKNCWQLEPNFLSNLMLTCEEFAKKNEERAKERCSDIFTKARAKCDDNHI